MYFCGMNIYRICYRNEADFYERADMLLGSLLAAGYVDKFALGILLSEYPDFWQMLEYLSDNGFATIDERNVSVSPDGRLFVARGGFKGKARRKVAGAVARIVGVVASVATILALVV